MASSSNVRRFEHISEPVAPWPRYLRRQLRGLVLGLVFILLVLVAGMIGYHRLAALSWADSYENAAMILSGMGPLASPGTFAGKVFSGSYALFCGIAALAITGVVAAPLVHRFLHRMHADVEDRH